MEVDGGKRNIGFKLEPQEPNSVQNCEWASLIPGLLRVDYRDVLGTRPML